MRMNVSTMRGSNQVRSDRDLALRGRRCRCGLKDVDDLSKQGHTRVHDPARRRGAWTAVSVRMLVETSDRVPLQCPRPHLRAISAPRSQCVSIEFLRICRCSGKYASVAKRSASPACMPGVRQHKAQNLGQTVIDRVEVAFERDIVDHIKPANARGIAAAARDLSGAACNKFPNLFRRQVPARPRSAYRSSSIVRNGRPVVP